MVFYDATIQYKSSDDNGAICCWYEDCFVCITFISVGFIK